LLVTHNSAIAAMADRVIKMQSGRIVSNEVNEHHQDPTTLEW
jgi:putative ABC transport system ATP-binding protein